MAYNLNRQPVITTLLFACLLLPAVANACGWTLSKNEEFPVRDYFPSVKITVGPRGELLFSKSSRAYIIWRQKTAPHVPDTAFAFQYLSREQLIRHVVEMSEEIPGSSWQPVFNQDDDSHILPEEVSSEDIAPIATFVLESLRRRPQLRLLQMNYLIFNDEDKGTITIAFNDIYSHQKAIHLIRSHHSNLKVVEGGYIEIAAEDSSRVTFRYSTGLRWIYDQNHSSVTGLQMDQAQVAELLKDEIRKAFAVHYQTDALELQGDTYQPRPVQRQTYSTGPTGFRLNLK